MSDYGLIGTLWRSRREKKERVVQIHGFVMRDQDYVVTRTISIEGKPPSMSRANSARRSEFFQRFDQI